MCGSSRKRCTGPVSAAETAFLSEVPFTLGIEVGQHIRLMRSDLRVWSPNEGDSPVTVEECLEGPTGCQGPVSSYPSLSGSGENYARCSRHYEVYVLRVQPRMDEIRRRYPHFAPRGFDPAYAGERWSDE